MVETSECSDPMDVASLRCSWVKPCCIIDTDSVYLTLLMADTEFTQELYV